MNTKPLHFPTQLLLLRGISPAKECISADVCPVSDNCMTSCLLFRCPRRAGDSRHPMVIGTGAEENKRLILLLHLHGMRLVEGGTGLLV
jgi:hypothetical protein